MKIQVKYLCRARSGIRRSGGYGADKKNDDRRRSLSVKKRRNAHSLPYGCCIQILINYELLAQDTNLPCANNFVTKVNCISNTDM